MDSVLQQTRTNQEEQKLMHDILDEQLSTMNQFKQETFHS